MKKTAKIVSTSILILLAITAILLAVPRLFGIRLYTVLGSSMEKTLSVGDLIYVVPTPPEKIQKGDIISFVLDEQLTVATHRVTAVDRENKKFTTKGDANQVEDAKPVSYGNVLGVEKFSIPKAGYLLYFTGTLPGRIIAVTVIFLLALIAFLLSDSKKDKS